jgi:hypothetical protein
MGSSDPVPGWTESGGFVTPVDSSYRPVGEIGEDSVEKISKLVNFLHKPN